MSPTGAGGVSSSIFVAVVGNASYTGPTTITGCEFVVGSISGGVLSPSSVVTVSGGFLHFANGGSTGPVTVNAPAALLCGGGAVSQIGNLTDLTMQPGSTLRMEMRSLANYGQLNASGNVNPGGATLNLLVVVHVLHRQRVYPH